MIFANILVHVDSRPRASARLALAVRIAERVGARLTGLFAEEAQAYVVGTVASWPSPHYTAALELARNAFSTVAAPLGARAMFMDVNRGSDHEIAHRFVAIARTFDLVVLGQTEEHAPALAKLPENVIVESGRPTLVVPYVGTYRDVGSRPLFAWHSSRGAARAVSDAMPLLAENCDGLVVEVGRRSCNSATNSPKFSSPTWRRTRSARAISISSSTKSA